MQYLVGLPRPRYPIVAFVFALVVAIPARAAAQQSMSDVLSFLLINRSVATADFVRDEQAAEASRDAISTFLLAELGTLPIDSSGSGFAYRLNEEFGISERSSDSFGPFFVERSLTVGAGQASFAVSYRAARFKEIDGRNLRDGSLVATAARLTTESAPFDVESLTLQLDTESVTAVGTVGLTDRLDIGASVPFLRIRLRGERLDTYRGDAILQAAGSGNASGLGDIAVRGKYNALRRGASGIALGAEARLPTGDEDNLLGTGRWTVRPRAVGSFESGAWGLHGDFGYVFGALSDEFDYGGAVTVAATRRVTLVGEIVGRRLSSFGALTESTSAHPTLTGVETIRLTSAEAPSNRMAIVGGFKWNIAATWLLTANVLRQVTSGGLNADWVPTVTFDYAFGQ